MALNIRSAEADRLARQLAELTGESLTEVVTVALRERVERVQRQRNHDFRRRLARLVDEYQSLEIEDPRTSDEIVGYDENGLPA